MIITCFLPRWLRNRLRKNVPKAEEVISEKNQEIIPAVTKPERSENRAQDDNSHLAYRFFWRL